MGVVYSEGSFVETNIREKKILSLTHTSPEAVPELSGIHLFL